MQDAAAARSALAQHLDWRRRLRDGLPDAARMLLAAMLAYALAHLLQLREAHWAVLTALITGRAQAGGTARAGAERLFATIAGAALAASVAALRAWHVDGAVLLFGVLAPLCLLVAVQPAFRTAPVAALIVLSSGLIAGTGPFVTAVLRTTEIALGSLCSVLVSMLVFPTRARAKSREQAATILHRLAEWLRRLRDDSTDTEQLREQLRTDLRELIVLARTAGWRKRQDNEAARLGRALMALQGDAGFLARALARKPLRDMDETSANALHAQIANLAGALDAVATAAQGKGELPSRAQVQGTIASGSGAGVPPVAQYLLQSVAGSLLNVIAVLAPEATSAAPSRNG